jgi:uroporphyrinogen-III decarboxylase
MNSRERLLAAIRRQPVDHVPLHIRLWSLGGEADHIPFDWHDQVTRAECLVGLSVDDTLLLQPPLGQPEEYRADECPGIDAEVIRIPAGDGRAEDALKKTYHTPAGALTQVVVRSEDWPHGDEVMLFSDYNVARYVQPLINGMDDVRKLRYLLADPTVEQLAEFRRRSETLHVEAQRLGVALEAGFIALGDSAVWLCGMENVLYWQMDQPNVIEELLETLLEWELKRERLLLEAGVDMVAYSAWYEGTDFLTPSSYRRLIKPRLKALVDQAHAYHVPFRYIITKGWLPLRRDLLEIGIDCIAGVDPIQDAVDLAEVKADIGEDVCLMGGINSAVMLTQFSDQAVRAAVDEAMRIMSPGGGFILHPVDCIPCEFPWDRTELIIDQWKRHWAM